MGKGRKTGGNDFSKTNQPTGQELDNE